GDRARGSRIVEEDEDSGVRSFMKHDKKEVWTRLHSETLRQMVAAVPSGTYFEVASGPFDLKGIYQQVMQRVERTTVEKQVVESYEDKFHLFLFAAVTVLLLSNPWKRNSKPWKNGRAAKTAALVLLLLSSLSVRAKESAAGLFRQGNKAYAAEKFDVAAEKFQAAGELDPESAEIYFNLGSALYRNGAFEEARGSFEYAASVSDSEQMKSQCWYNLANSMVKTAETLRLQDPHSALEFYQQAAYIYRTALDYNMEFADAAYNMEVTRMLTAQLTEEIRQEEEKEQQENEMFKYIREKLEEFILRQTALNTATTADTLSAAAQQQQTLEKETRELTEVMKETGLHEAIPFPDGTAEPGPLQKTFEHTLKAAAAMERAQQYPALDPVQMEQKIALEELIAALGSAPADPNQQEGESDEDSSESDDSDMDYDESDEDSDMYEEADPFGDFSEYEEIRGVPPPNQTEMDILAEEARNQERRKQKKGGQYKGVDKDW
ncbi:MAG: tetratricopeptide repeat protein, partial [Kiritimatiellales bacterium]|nr:tetratricopeptide repeat protein [Kiritimatiellales bacterium]